MQSADTWKATVEISKSECSSNKYRDITDVKRLHTVFKNRTTYIQCLFNWPVADTTQVGPDSPQKDDVDN